MIIVVVSTLIRVVVGCTSIGYCHSGKEYTTITIIITTIIITTIIITIITTITWTMVVEFMTMLIAL